MSYIGTTEIGKMFLGDTEIGKVYLGEDLVFDASGGSITPSLPYDAQVEYLQSSGTQYIDTGIVATTNFECELKGQFIQNNDTYDTLLGSYDNNYAVAIGLQSGSSGKLYTQLGTSYALSQASTLALHTFKSSLKSGTLKIDVDGTSVTTTFAGSLSALSMYLFGRKRTTTAASLATAKIYYCKIWNGGNLVFDAIPVRVGQVGYMYDRISGRLFGNSGSGDFSLGSDTYVVPQPTQYTTLDYIKFTGSQYLMFDYYTNPNTHIEIDMQFESNGNASNTSAVNAWLGNYENTNGSFGANFGGAANQFGEIFYWFEGGYVSNVWSYNYGANIYNRSTWIYNNNQVTFLGVNKATETKTLTQNGKLTIGGRKNSGAAEQSFNRHNLKVYSMKIYDGSTLLLDMTPKSDGTNNGLYDSINDKFYTSMTGTNLIGA